MLGTVLEPILARPHQLPMSIPHQILQQPQGTRQQRQLRDISSCTAPLCSLQAEAEKIWQPVKRNSWALLFIKRLPRERTEVNGMGYIKSIYSFMAPSRGHQSFLRPRVMVGHLQTETGLREYPGPPEGEAVNFRVWGQLLMFSSYVCISSTAAPGLTTLRISQPALWRQEYFMTQRTTFW